MSSKIVEYMMRHDGAASREETKDNQKTKSKLPQWLNWKGIFAFVFSSGKPA